jgi:hypothetical protein
VHADGLLRLLLHVFTAEGAQARQYGLDLLDFGNRRRRVLWILTPEDLIFIARSRQQSKRLQISASSGTFPQKNRQKNGSRNEQINCLDEGLGLP